MFGSTAKPASSSFSFGSSQPSSGFGASNTATSGGLFGLQQQKPQSSGLFGSGTQNTSTGGGLFGSNQNATTNTGSTGFGASNNASGGLFGSGNQASGQQNTLGSSSGGLFGQKPAGSGVNIGGGSTGSSLFGQKPAAPSTGGGLFGSNTQQSQTGQSGGLFGASSNTATQNTSGGLFGLKPAAPTGGLFGSSNQSSTAPKPAFGTSGTSTGGGLFGQSNTSNQSGGGLFGGSSNTGGGLFGGSSNTSTLGGLFGGLQQQQNQQQQANQQATQLTAMTRFGDLPPDAKKELQQFDQYISTQHLIATTLSSDLKKHNQLVKSIDSDVNYLHNKISTIKQALKGDSNQLKALKAVNDELTEDIGNIMQLIIQLSTPGTKLSSSFQLNEFFVKKIKHYKDVMASYENIIKEGEEAIRGLQNSANDTMGSIYDVVEVVKNQYNVFMELCETLAQVHSEVQQLKRV